jgi:hypothetical protein
MRSKDNTAGYARSMPGLGGIYMHCMNARKYRVTRTATNVTGMAPLVISSGTYAAPLLFPKVINESACGLHRHARTEFRGQGAGGGSGWIDLGYSRMHACMHDD